MLGLVRESRRIGGEGVAVEADELEGVGRVVDAFSAAARGPLGDEAGIRPVEEKDDGARVEPAQRALDAPGLDGDHGAAAAQGVRVASAAARRILICSARILGQRGSAASRAARTVAKRWAERS